VRGWRKGGEMTQTLYAHMNKIKIEKKKKNEILSLASKWMELENII
jgi:hypothetical protein